MGGYSGSVTSDWYTMRKADRDDVLKALYGHILRTVIVSVEAPDGSTLLRVQGTLVPGSRGPGEQTDVFALISQDVDAHVWFWDAEKRQKYGVADIRATGAFSVPYAGIVEYMSDDRDASSYRFGLGDGTEIAVTLWNAIPGRAESGGVIPADGNGRRKGNGQRQVDLRHLRKA